MNEETRSNKIAITEHRSTTDDLKKGYDLIIIIKIQNITKQVF